MIMNRLLITLLLSSMPALAAEFAAKDLEFFEKKIRPVLAEHCFKCHSADAKKLKGGLLLDHRAGVLKGGDSGPSIVSGKPEESLLIEALHRSQCCEQIRELANRSHLVTGLT